MPHSDNDRETRAARRSEVRGNCRDLQLAWPPLCESSPAISVTVDASRSKAIALLVRLGLEDQENRKREFFKRFKENLASDDPDPQDRLVDEFRALILGH